MNVELDLRILEEAVGKAVDTFKPKISRLVMNELIKHKSVLQKEDPYMKNPKLKSQGKKNLILSSPHSPGDIAMMSAAIRDLHNTYPGEYKTDVDSPCNEIYEGNPYITKLDKNAPDVAFLRMHYPLIHDSNEGSYHFIHGYRKYLEECIGRPIKQGKMKPDIHIREEEKLWLSAVEEVTKDKRPFWIIDAGYKNDFTAKAWSFDRYQSVVNHFKDRIQFVQIGHKDHNHPKLKGVIDMVGQTDIRQLIRLVYHSVGVLTPVSFPMVLAAGVPMANPKLKNRACVVLSGGREPVQWQMYPNHQFLHTCGTMPCCDNGGCWKSRVVPIGDGDEKDKSNLCLFPVNLSSQWIARCMEVITTDDVIRSIERYYTGGVLEYDKNKTLSYRYESRDTGKTNSYTDSNNDSSPSMKKDRACKVIPIDKEHNIKSVSIDDTLPGIGK